LICENRPLNNKTLEIISRFNKIEFDKEFNQNVDNLPDNITHLSFVNSFSLKIFHFTFVPSSDFNQVINKYPINLTHLTFGTNYNQPLNNLPNSLIYLSFELRC
jgi:hypothetical protein